MKENIKKLVEAETGVEDISTRSRKQHIVEARIIYSVLCLRHTIKCYHRRAEIMINPANRKSYSHNVLTKF